MVHADPPVDGRENGLEAGGQSRQAFGMPDDEESPRGEQAMELGQ